MKKLFVLAAAAGLLTLGACHKSPQEQAVDNAGDQLQANLQNQADVYEAAADNATNAAVENQDEVKANNLEDAADDAHDAVKNAH